MRFLVSCPFGLSKILNNELQHLGLTTHHSFETGVYVDGDYRDMIQINLWSRIANKVYLEASFGACSTFDHLFDLVGQIDWSNFVGEGQNIVVNVHTKGSKLESTRTIQSITNKAIFKKISPDTKRVIDGNQNTVDVFVMILNDNASLFINSSGEPLHQRGYRTQTGDAPLKENLAAALVVLSNWKYSAPFWDPCCGSGTLAIEAAMLARNIAPGLQRNFAFQQWKNVDTNMLTLLKEEAKNKQYTTKEYQIYASDTDTQLLSIAQNNAQHAGVYDTIIFTQHDITNPLVPHELKYFTLVSNPPYGKRLAEYDLKQIYTHLIDHISQSNGGGFITSYAECERLLSKERKKKKLFNGADECLFYSKNI